MMPLGEYMDWTTRREAFEFVPSEHKGHAVKQSCIHGEVSHYVFGQRQGVDFDCPLRAEPALGSSAIHSVTNLLNNGHMSVVLGGEGSVPFSRAVTRGW